MPARQLLTPLAWRQLAQRELARASQGSGTAAVLVIDLDEFDDNRDGSNEAKLEAIQMAWHEIYKEQNEDDSE